MTTKDAATREQAIEDRETALKDQTAPIWTRIEDMGSKLQGLGQLMAYVAVSEDGEIQSWDQVSTLIEALESHLDVLNRAVDDLRRVGSEIEDTYRASLPNPFTGRSTSRKGA
jgi:chaperonin cofactor prefoldin